MIHTHIDLTYLQDRSGSIMHTMGAGAGELTLGWIHDGAADIRDRERSDRPIQHDNL